MTDNVFREPASGVRKLVADLEEVLSRYREPEVEKTAESQVPDGVALAIRIYRARRARARCFPDHADLFGEPAWDVLLDLYIAGERGEQVSVSSVGVAADVPSTTALRWIGMLTERGLIERSADGRDGRRKFLALTAAGKEGVELWLRLWLSDERPPQHPSPM